jgi:hypothetical protein
MKYALLVVVTFFLGFLFSCSSSMEEGDLNTLSSIMDSNIQNLNCSGCVCKLTKENIGEGVVKMTEEFEMGGLEKILYRRGTSDIGLRFKEGSLEKETINEGGAVDHDIHKGVVILYFTKNDESILMDVVENLYKTATDCGAKNISKEIVDK